jgi:hypothetical protein
MQLELRGVLFGEKQGELVARALGIGLESRELLGFPVRGGLGGDVAELLQQLWGFGQQILNRWALGMVSRDFHVARVAQLQQHPGIRIQFVVSEQLIETRGKIP